MIGIICPIINAKNNNIYVCLFKSIDVKYSLIRDMSFENIDNFLEELSHMNISENLYFVGDGAILFENLLKENFNNCIISKSNDLSSINLALAGLQHFKSGDDLNNINPLYLRKSQAERGYIK